MQKGVLAPREYPMQDVSMEGKQNEGMTAYTCLKNSSVQEGIIVPICCIGRPRDSGEALVYDHVFSAESPPSGRLPDEAVALWVEPIQRRCAFIKKTFVFEQKDRYPI
ncbi:MAG: hypothetical protein CMH54_15645 [Myxococcales bacterium]|nr:hypothetical protein [Myxococcales bacterium]|tara:strand:+ start:577 stop:900 length:324 start_codon:yes stop_codon:yes gene_type:complete